MADEAGTKTDFPVDWEDPADAERSWQFDLIHTPDVMTPLGFELYYLPFARGFGFGLEPRQANYYVYTAREGAAAQVAQLPPVDVERLREGAAQWRDTVMPEVVRHTEHYRQTDFDSHTEDGLIQEIDRLAELRVRQGQLHTMAMLPWMMGMNHLVDTHRELTGGDDLSAMRLVQGYGNKSVEAGQELWKLTRLADSIPSVRERLAAVTNANAPEVMSALEGDSAAAPFREAFAAYLDQYGWRSDLFELSSLTWAEDPTIPLCQLRAYLELDSYDPTAELSKLAEERDAAVRDVLAGLQGEDRARLEAIIDAAAALISIQEDHNFYLDQRLAYMPRRLLLAAGRRLASKGDIPEASDVFFLRAEEVKAALAGRADGTAETAGRRKEEMAKWAAVPPPAFIGAEPEEEEIGLIARFQGTPVLRSERPNELAGNSGSAGVTRGPARVLLSLSEADRLKPGDVLVARTTMPAWTPLFAVACAIVTESGGVLSHAAVVAREYGIPAVLTVKDATSLIRDGQLVEVDGDSGMVRILS